MWWYSFTRHFFSSSAVYCMLWQFYHHFRLLACSAPLARSHHQQKNKILCSVSRCHWSHPPFPYPTSPPSSASYNHRKKNAVTRPLVPPPFPYQLSNSPPSMPTPTLRQQQQSAAMLTDVIGPSLTLPPKKLLIQACFALQIKHILVLVDVTGTTPPPPT